MEKAKLSARSPFEPLLCTWDLKINAKLSFFKSDLIEPKVNPGHDKSSPEHCAIGTLDRSQGPKDESEPKYRERNVSIGDLAQGSSETFQVSSL